MEAWVKKMAAANALRERRIEKMLGLMGDRSVYLVDLYMEVLARAVVPGFWDGKYMVDHALRRGDLVWDGATFNVRRYVPRAEGDEYGV